MRLKLILLFSFFMLLLSLNAYAEGQVSKAQWIADFKAELPGLFCKDGSYFRECFRLTKEECLKEARSHINECVSMHEPTIPKKLKQPRDGQKFGGNIGACAGQEFDNSVSQKRINSEKCKDPNAWK